MKVVHCKKEPYDVYIGRPSKWGNPFEMKDKSAAERRRVIEAYREWIKKQPELLNSLEELEGKTLGCWCHPKPCHGDFLVQMVQRNKVYRELKQLVSEKLRHLLYTQPKPETCESVRHMVNSIIHSRGLTPYPDDIKVVQDGNIFHITNSWWKLPYEGFRLDFKIPGDKNED